MFVNRDLHWDASLNPYIDSARLVIPYSDSMLYGKNVNESTLEIRFYNGIDWQALPCILDTIHHRVTADIAISGPYALFADYKTSCSRLPDRGMAIDRVSPNPFNQTTVIDYFQSGNQDVKIQIFDTRGALVKTLVSQTLKPGPYRMSWNGVDNSGRPLSSGIYLLRVQSGNDRMNKKIHLIR